MARGGSRGGAKAYGDARSAAVERLLGGLGVGLDRATGAAISALTPAQLEKKVQG